MSIISSIKSSIKKARVSLTYYRRYRRYSSQYKSYLKEQQFENKKAPGEDAYMKKREVLCPRVESYSYRFSYWFYMYTNQTAFGNCTDEIIDYCRRNKIQVLK